MKLSELTDAAGDTSSSKRMRLSDLSTPQAPPKPEGGGLISYVGNTVGGAMKDAWDTLKGDASAFSADSTVTKGQSLGEGLRKSADQVLRTAKLPMDVLGLATSPIAGAINTVAKPLRDHTGLDLNLALEGMGPEFSEVSAGSAAAHAGIFDKAAMAEHEGTRYVARLTEGAGKTPADIRTHPTHMAGKPITGAEAIGRPGVSHLGAIARRSGQTGDALESQMRTRQQEQPDRVMGDLERATGISPHAIEGDFASHTKALRAKAGPLYDAAYAKGPMHSEKLQELLKRPSVKQALHHAYTIAQEEGRAPEAIGFARVDAPVVMDGKPLMRNGKPITAPQDIQLKQPTAQTWDYVKRGLDDVMEGYRDKTTRRLNLDENGRATRDTLRDLRDELFNVNPEYRKAVAAGGEPLQQEDAFRSADKLMKGTTNERAFLETVSKYTPAQQEAFKGGIIRDLYDRAQSGSLKLKDTQNDLYKKKLGYAIGDKAAEHFLSAIDQEMGIAATGKRMSFTNSTTSEFQAADKEREANMREGMSIARKFGRGDWLGGTTHALSTAATKAYAAARSPSEEAVRDHAGKLLMGSPDALAQALEAMKPKAAERDPMGPLQPPVTHRLPPFVAQMLAAANASR